MNWSTDEEAGGDVASHEVVAAVEEARGEEEVVGGGEEEEEDNVAHAVGPDYPIWFRDQACMKWHDKRADKGFIEEKTIHPELDYELGISYAFNSMGFINVTQIQGHYYPALVKQFYSNAFDKEGPDSQHD